MAAFSAVTFFFLVAAPLRSLTRFLSCRQRPCGTGERNGHYVIRHLEIKSRAALVSARATFASLWSTQYIELITESLKVALKHVHTASFKLKPPKYSSFPVFGSVIIFKCCYSFH